MIEETLQKRTINPHEEATLNAGKFDVNTHTPKIVLKLDYPDSIKNLVTWREELIGSAEQCVKVFKILNESNLLVYARLVKQP